MITLIVQRWHTECGNCGYGSGGYMASPALEGKPILTPESTVCPGCNQTFTHTMDPYVSLEPEPIGS